MLLKTILQTLKDNYPQIKKEEIALVTKAYAIAEKKVKGIKRGSMNYFDHLSESALMIAKIKSTPVTVAATLLHDLVHRTSYTFTEMEKDFGSEITDLLVALEDLRGIERRFKGTEQYVENAKRMLVAVAKDFRVLLIKFVDRLNNLQHLDTFTQIKQKKRVEMAEKIYIPLLGILGIWHLRWQFEDLCFAYHHPQIYKKIYSKIESGLFQKRQDIVGEVKGKILSLTQKKSIHCEIDSRFKHVASVYRKMQEKKLRFNEIYDVFAVRVVVDNIDDCYLMLGLIHSLWKPVPRRIKDYIALAKPNGYQSLHTTVFTEAGNFMEFQIRTREMDDEAKYGVAAHWYYKRPYGDRNIPEWIKGIIKARQIYEKSSGLVDKIDLNALTDDIFCYTPRGDIIELPRGSTPVDFAYAVHTELGHYCKSAMINDSPRSLDFTLKNNDIVEIVKKFKKQPLKNWLEFVKTQRAKDSIRQFYNRR